MKDYYQSFVGLCLQMYRWKEINDDEKFKKHNLAVQRLEKLKKEMSEVDCSEVMERLLAHDDDRVKMSAAYFCIKQGYHTDKARQIVTEIFNDKSKDPVVRIDAMILIKFKGIW